MLYGSSKALSWILSAFQVLGILKDPAWGTYYGLLFKGPHRDFVVYQPFDAPKASIRDFVTNRVCVSVGCFSFNFAA